jgi:protocatechuate 3,4-dioxygenase beta subunit
MKQTLMTRRAALVALTGTAGAAALMSCSGGNSSGAASTSTTTSGGTATGTSLVSTTCVVTPEGEIGPYFVDDSLTGFNRTDIRSNIDGTKTQTGIPLTLNVVVQDAENNCIGMQDVQIDIWHCNASGVYSDEGVESTTGETWLRGYQLTDSAGEASFITIFPGWYEGRTTHIHLRVRSKYSTASSTSDGTNTTQIFFAQTLVDSINTTVAPYSSHGTNSTTNASDRVYEEQTEGLMEVVLTGNTSVGYTTTVTIGLPITEV